MTGVQTCALPILHAHGIGLQIIQANERTVLINRQLLGEKILVFMNDSTVRFAHVIGQALSVEQMPDSVHFNQISSSLSTGDT